MRQEDPYAVTATDPPVRQCVCKTVRLTLDFPESIGSDSAVCRLMNKRNPGVVASPAITDIGSDVVSRWHPPTKATRQVLVAWSV